MYDLFTICYFYENKFKQITSEYHKNLSGSEAGS